MRRLFVLTIVAGLLLNANAFAKRLSSEEKQKMAEAKGMVCHPEALLGGQREAGIRPPCAPPNYIFMGITDPLQNDAVVQKDVTHDASGIWSDSELGSDFVTWIWERRVKIGSKEVTMSKPVGPICAPTRTCPIRIRIKEPGKPDVIKSVREEGGSYPCGTLEDLFIRNDLKTFLACSEEFSLE